MEDICYGLMIYDDSWIRLFWRHCGNILGQKYKLNQQVVQNTKYYKYLQGEQQHIPSLR